MKRKLINTIEYTALGEIERQLTYNPEFSCYSIQRERVLQDVLNRLTPHYQLLEDQTPTFTQSLSFFQQERLREIVHETLCDYIKGQTSLCEPPHPSVGSEVYQG